MQRLRNDLASHAAQTRLAGGKPRLLEIPSGRIGISMLEQRIGICQEGNQNFIKGGESIVINQNRINGNQNEDRED